MKATLRCALLAGPLAAAFILSSSVGRAAAPASPQGFITERAYLNIGGGTAVSDLTNASKFPNLPDIVAYPKYFEFWAKDDGSPPPGNNYNSYGGQLVGYFYPPIDGTYVFYLSADDNASLYLSTDADPANKHLIAAETGWSSERQFLVSAGSTDTNVVNHKRSDRYTGTAWPVTNANGLANITLTANTPYYIEALFKEGGGGDNLSVSINATNPIPGAYLSSIDRPDLTSPYFVSLTGHAGGFWAEIQEVAGGTQVNFASVQATLNGNPITVTSTRRTSDNIVAVSYLASPLLAVGSTNSVTINFTSGALQQTATRTYVVGGYQIIPANYAVSTATDPGFTLRAYQMSIPANPGQNSIGSAEQQWARGF